MNPWKQHKVSILLTIASLLVGILFQIGFYLYQQDHKNHPRQHKTSRDIIQPMPNHRTHSPSTY